MSACAPRRASHRIASNDPPKPDGLSQLPIETTCGIYFLWQRSEIVYVGQSKHVTQRIYQHIQDGIKRFDGFSFIRVKASKLSTFERYYIEKLLPRYNQCGIANAMRRLRGHGYTGLIVSNPQPTNAEKAAHFLGISVDALLSLNLSEEITVRVPRGNFRRRVTRWRNEALREWADANPDLLLSMRT